MTNYEKIIASLTPERLAEKLEMQGCYDCPVIRNGNHCPVNLTLRCKNIIVDWLKQEAE